MCHVRRVGAGATPLLALVLLTAPTPATAAPPPRAETASTLGLPEGASALAAAGPALELDGSRQQLTPGLVLERRATLDAAGAVRSELLRLSPGAAVRPQLLQQDLSTPRTPADLARAAGAVAAVNGDFFDIDRTGTPDGPVVVAGTALKADAGAQRAVGIDAGPGGWVGRLGQVLLAGSASVGGRGYPLSALNTRTVAADSVALFSPAWGDGDRALAAPAGGVELEVRSGRVSAVRAPGALPVPADGFVLVATGSAAAALAGTAPGTAATVEQRVRDDASHPGSTGFALGARLELVRDGRVAPIDALDPTWAALRARTALGWSATGDLLLLTIDGGTSRSRGVTALETAQRMLDAGAVGAVMLDGGGSAQLVARTPGGSGVEVVGEPSDGSPRPVANAVGLVPAPGDGRTASVLVRPVLDGAPAEEALRVFPGLRRVVEAVGLDGGGALAPLDAPVWSVGAPTAAVSGVGARALVRGTAPGRTGLAVAAGASTGGLDVEVLGPLAGLGLDAVPVLPAAGATADVTVWGWDAEGRRAPLDAADVAAATDPAQLTATALPDGRLRLTAVTAGPVVADLRLGAGAVSGGGPVAVGSVERPLDRLEDPARWTTGATRATATLQRVPVPDLPGTGAALRLGYDFRGPDAGTAVASLLPTAALPLPAGSRELALWVRGDGGGGWLRALLRVDGASRPVDLAPRVDWTGWRRLVVPVPAGARDVALERLYLAQTDVGLRRAGTVDLALLDTRVGASPTPADPGPRDPAQGPVTGGAARVALVGGTHVTTAGGAGALERALRSALAAGARQVLLTGDVVGAPGARGTDADVALVRDALARTLPAGVGWAWVPGDGEVGTTAAAGPASTGAPATHRRLDVAGTRYLLLDAAGGTLRGSDPEQLPWLRAELSAAAADPGVRGVVLVSAHGPGAGAGALGDPDESALLRRWTRELRTGGGDRVAVVAPGPQGVRREEGVLEVGTPAVVAAGRSAGSWTLLGVDAAASTPPAAALARPAGSDDGWLRAQSHPAGPQVARSTRVTR